MGPFFFLLATAAGASPLLGVWSGDFRQGDTRVGASFTFTPGPLQVTLDIPELKFHHLGPIPVRETPAGATADAFSFTLAGDRLGVRWSFDGHELVAELRRGPLPPRAPPQDVEARVAKPAWTFPTGGAIWSSPATDGRLVFFGSTDGSLYALEASSGRLAWRFETGRPIVGPPSHSGGQVYVLSDDGFLYKLAAGTGALAWRFDTHGGAIPRVLPAPGVNTAYDTFGSAPAIAGGLVYVGSADGRLYAVNDQTGVLAWSFPTGGLVRSSPAVGDGRVVFGSSDHKVYSLDAATGALLWSRDTLREVVSSPLLEDGTVVIGSRSSDLLALDARTGTTRWSYFYWSSWVESSARIRDGVLYVGSSDYQQVFAIRARDGQKVWAFGTGGSPWSTPWVEGDRVFIGAVGVAHYFIDHQGGFFAVDRRTGKALWRVPFPPPPGAEVWGVNSSPVVAGGLVLFGGLDGTFYAFPLGG
jgi:outer membrane protein assembly factor BamB